MSARPVTTRTAWPIVARREILAKLTDRAFLVGTVLTIVVIGAFMGVQAFLGERTQTYAVTASPANAPMARAIADGAAAIDDKVEVTVKESSDDAAARAAVDAKSADAWLHKEGETWVLTGREEVASGLASVAAEVVRDRTLSDNVTRAGTTMEAITAGSTLKTALLVGDAERQGFAKGLGFVFAVLFYMAALGFGITLAMSVVEEKASRIVEIITTKIPVRALLAGKIAGNTVLAFAQMALYVAIGLVGLSFTPYKSYLSGIGAPVFWFLVFFVVGFLLLACLFAVAGALASRTEDVQATSMPLTMLTMGMFFGAFLLKGTALTVASFLPPLSAILMPVRVAQGGVPLWQPVLALVLLLAAAAVVVVFAERLYRRSLLQTQGRISIKQAWATPE